MSWGRRAGARHPRLKIGAANSGDTSARARGRPSRLSRDISRQPSKAARLERSWSCMRGWTTPSKASPTPKRPSSLQLTISPANNAVSHSIGLIGFGEAEHEVAQVVAEGIRTIKIKVGVDPDRDVEMVRRIRDTVGPGIALCVDANQGYRTPGEAIRTLRRMERSDLIYFEQPVEGIERLAQVARAIDVPVMADESAWNAHDVIQIIEQRAAQIVSLYTTKPGGLYRAMEAAAVARAAGLICNVNGSVETGIGNLANLALAAAAPCVLRCCCGPVSR